MALFTVSVIKLMKLAKDSKYPSTHRDSSPWHCPSSVILLPGQICNFCGGVLSKKESETVRNRCHQWALSRLSLSLLWLTVSELVWSSLTVCPLQTK